MPPQDPLRKGHAAASDDAAVHGQPPAQAVMDGRGKERKRRKHEDAAAGAGVATTAAQLSEINVAADGGGDTGGALLYCDPNFDGRLLEFGLGPLRPMWCKLLIPHC